MSVAFGLKSTKNADVVTFNKIQKATKDQCSCLSSFTAITRYRIVSILEIFSMVRSVKCSERKPNLHSVTHLSLSCFDRHVFSSAPQRSTVYLTASPSAWSLRAESCVCMPNNAAPPAV